MDQRRLALAEGDRERGEPDGERMERHQQEHSWRWCRPALPGCLSNGAARRPNERLLDSATAQISRARGNRRRKAVFKWWV